jgi:(p)ppGpp synthase/HD superfamily hydrolase
MLYTPRFETALSFAARLHANQTRKGISTPYIGHLLGVASLVIEHGGDEDEAIAALLHDAVEDQGGKATESVIRRMFGKKVTDIVRGCTDCEDEGGPKPAWRPRKEAYIDHLKHADASTRIVSASDKLYNARSILDGLRLVGDDVWKRFTAGREGQLWYYRSLAKEFLRAGPEALARELDATVKQIETWKP